MALQQPDGKGVLLYTGAMVSYTHQINGLLDALSDKGAAIVRARLGIRSAVANGEMSSELGAHLLEYLETTASKTKVSSPQDS